MYVAYSNRDPEDPNVLPVKFAFAQQRATPGLHDAVPPDADPVAGMTETELRDAGWARGGTYGEGRYSRGGHRHRSVQTAITPTMTNRPESTWLEPANPPEDHLLRLDHDGWIEPVDLGGRWYGTQGLCRGGRTSRGPRRVNRSRRAPTT